MARKQSLGTDVFQILRTDHQEVSKLMDQIKQADEPQKQQLFSQLQEELNDHMNLEERFFYPKLEENEDLADLVQDSYADHDDIRQILQQMSEQDFNSEEWQTNCEALEDTKDDHIDVEEEEIFPQAAELMDANVLNQIGEMIAAEKSSKSETVSKAPKTQKRPPRAHA